MKRKLPLLLAALSLSGCTIAETATVYKARSELIGWNIVDLLGCAGIPSKLPLQVEKDEVLVEWTETVSGSGTLSVALPMGATVKLGTPAGSCNFDALVFRDGTVAQVGFNGPGLADAAAVCSGRVSECLMHPNQTELPPGFDAIAMLMSARISSQNAGSGGSSSSDELDVTVNSPTSSKSTTVAKPAPAKAPAATKKAS